MKITGKTSITVLLPAGRLPLDIMKESQKLAEEYGFGVYLSTAQNLRLINVPESVIETVKKELGGLGAEFKGPGKFPIPRLCVGKPHCNLGIVDTEAVCVRILERFGDRKKVKGKLKIAVAGCAMCCSAPKITDIGIFATRDGYEVYTGGKGGAFPKIGRRIARKASEEKVLEIIEILFDYHDRKTVKKQRMTKLLQEEDFPFKEV
ncbi:nitrite reductase [Desulfomarina sp.]